MITAGADVVLTIPSTKWSKIKVRLFYTCWLVRKINRRSLVNKHGDVYVNCRILLCKLSSLS